MNNEYTLNPAYKEIIRLSAMLKQNNIKHDLTRLFDGWQIRVIDNDSGYQHGDIIEHFGSYGADADLLETWGFRKDDVHGCRSAEECLKVIGDYLGRKLTYIAGVELYDNHDVSGLIDE